MNLQIEQLQRLPQRRGEVWQGGLVRLPIWGPVERKDEDEEGGCGCGCECADTPLFRPVTSFWVSVRTRFLGFTKDVLAEGSKDFAAALTGLAAFATDADLAGYRPEKVEVHDPDLAAYLAPLLAEAGIRVDVRAKLPALEETLRSIEEMLTGEPPAPGPLEGKGVTVERMRAFADAARAFYEAAPWQHLDSEDLLVVEAPASAPSDLRHLTINGSAGFEFGLGFHRTADSFWAILTGRGREQAMAGGVCMHTYGPIEKIPFADADLWEDRGLPVAGPRAYPAILRYDARGRLRRAGSDVLAYVEGLLRVLAAATEAEIDSGRWTKRVETADGPRDYTLALPLLLQPPSLAELAKRGMPPDPRSLEVFHVQAGRFAKEEGISDLDELNARLKREFLGKPLDPARYPPRTPQEEAQALCYQAFESMGRRQIVLARQALKICPDCADAYVILAEAIFEPARRLPLFLAGVEAGRRALGPEAFEKDAGHFWGLIETRPFMRALRGAATAHEMLGDIEAAAADYRELLRLNPGDNQGVRYWQLPLLIRLGRDDEAAALLDSNPEDPAAVWVYSRALLAFRKSGDGPAARASLQAALAVNQHVPTYLLGHDVDSDSEFDSDDDALDCADTLGLAWEDTPGALEWLSAVTGITLAVDVDDEEDEDDAY